jgi:hypothetical protein
MENLNIHTDGENQIITVLEGTALTPREPKKVSIDGSITAPATYVGIRSADAQKDHVVFSRSKMFIRYTKNETDELGATVNGRLLFNPDLEEFGINKQKTLMPKEMASKLKLSRTFFPDKEINATIVTALNAFTATITTELEKIQDTRGNSKQLVEKKVISNTPTNFDLSLPIFVGQRPMKFAVEICIDTTDTGVKCWLESPELNDLILQNRDAIIDGELEKIKQVCGLPIIEEV